MPSGVYRRKKRCPVCRRLMAIGPLCRSCTARKREDEKRARLDTAVYEQSLKDFEIQELTKAYPRKK